MKKIAFLILVLGMVSIGFDIKGQTAPGLPQRDGLVLSPKMKLSFGDFICKPVGTGTITVFPNNIVDPINVYIYPGRGTNPAMFEFKLCPGRVVIIKILDFSDTFISYNGNNMKVDFSSSLIEVDGGQIIERGSDYVKFTSNKGCHDIHRIYVGGILNVGLTNSNPKGFYSGDLKLEIIQQ